ncbi:exo-alpha-sialidase, partial [Rothia nasimurium]
PVLNATSAPGSYTEQNIANQLIDGAKSNRIPALTNLGKGVLVAAWDSRPNGAIDAPNPNSVVMRRSTDNGATWGPVTYIARGQLATATSPRYGYSDPSFVYDRETGTLFAFLVYSQDAGYVSSTYGNSTATDRTIIGAVITQSTDGGLTWSAPRDITPIAKPGSNKTNPQPGDVRGMFATSGEGIQLRYGTHKGRLIQQFTGRVKQADGTETTQAYALYSDDHGTTWKRGAYTGTKMDENKVVELSDGRVMLNSRDATFSGARKTAISTDGGVTYGPVTLDTELADPKNNASIFRMYPDAPAGSADAKKLIFTNTNNKANTDRVNLTARVSCDNGETWPGIRQIRSGTAAYSSGTALGNGRYGVLYEVNYGADIRYATFDTTWLNTVCAPMTAPAISYGANQSTQTVPVTITNQEATPISGTLTINDAAGFTAPTVPVPTIAPGSSATVKIQVSASSTMTQGEAEAVFTATDGKQSRALIPATRTSQDVPFAVTISDGTAPARNITTNPYRVGDKLTYTFRVTNTTGETVDVIPRESTFDTGFLTTSTANCRWRGLDSGARYTCRTATHTITQADLDRGYFYPRLIMEAVSTLDRTKVGTSTYEGEPIKLKEVTGPITVTGYHTNPATNYAPGDRISYSFTIANTGSRAFTVTPVEGSLETGFFTTSSPNCRWRGLAAGARYTCRTATHTITQADLDRGYFQPSATFETSGSGTPVRVTLEGQRIPLP